MLDREYTLSELIALAKGQTQREKELARFVERFKKISADLAGLASEIERIRTKLSPVSSLPSIQSAIAIVDKVPLKQVSDSDSSVSPVKLAREAIPRMRATGFTVRDMETRIRLDHPEINGSLTLPVLSRTLKRLADDGVISVKAIGRGKRATVFEVRMNTA